MGTTPSQPLSPGLRSRLRSTVDVTALECLLAAMPVESREVTRLHFSREVSADEVIAALRQAGSTQDASAFAAAIERASASSDHPFCGDGPTDPALLALWRAVEPGCPVVLTAPEFPRAG